MFIREKSSKVNKPREPRHDKLPVNGSLGPWKRCTNQLMYMLNNVVVPLFETDEAFPIVFQDRSRINLGIIKERLENSYYWSGADVLADFEKMFVEQRCLRFKNEFFCDTMDRLQHKYEMKVMNMPEPEVEY